MKRLSKNTRAVIHPNAAVWAAVLAETEAMGFSPSDIVNRALLAAGYGAPTVKPKGKELPPVKVWDGDPYQDSNYFPPEQRAGLYRAEQWSPKRIREHENLVMRKWPQAETVYEAGLVREE